MELRVDIQILPHPDTLPAMEADKLFDGELVEFEKWFLRKQRDHGAIANPLIGAERGIIKSYLLYAATVRREC